MRMRVVAGVLALAPGLQTPTPTPVTGTDAASGIQYAFVSIEGKGARPGRAAARLTAQCTRTSQGKLRFELLADAGDVAELRFVTPWTQTKDQLYPPVTPAASVTMEFLGYVKVKPVRRRWAMIDGLPGEWKYATPAMGSPNLEQVTFYLQYLKALPTLRLTWPAERGGVPVVLEFETTEWQKRVKAEPLCGASGL